MWLLWYLAGGGWGEVDRFLLSLKQQGPDTGFIQRRRTSYPSQSTFLELHCMHTGRASSHFTLRARQVQHPVDVLIRLLRFAGPIGNMMRPNTPLDDSRSHKRKGPSISFRTDSPSCWGPTRCDNEGDIALERKLGAAVGKR